MIRFTILLICLSLFLTDSVSAQVEQTPDQILAWIYLKANTNSSVSPSQIIEKLAGKPVSLFAANIHGQENAICHLLATRGCTLEFCFLLDNMSVTDREWLVKRLNSSYDSRNWLVQHKLLIGFQTDYWIGEFQKRGLDFSIPPRAVTDVKRLETAVRIRWQAETKAYRQHLKLVAAKAQSENNK